MSGPAYDLNQPTPPKSSNSWIWITLLVLLVLLLVCGGLCGGCSWWIGKSVRQGAQSAFQTIELVSLQDGAMNAISSNDQVAERIGTVTSYDPPKLVGKSGVEQPTITCRFAVSGERASATATVTGAREAGTLRPTDIVVTFGDGTSVDVPVGGFSSELNYEIEPQGSLPGEESLPNAADSLEGTNSD
jgi:hypothetical protein